VLLNLNADNSGKGNGKQVQSTLFLVYMKTLVFEMSSEDTKGSGWSEEQAAGSTFLLE